MTPLPTSPSEQPGQGLTVRENTLAPRNSISAPLVPTADLALPEHLRGAAASAIADAWAPRTTEVYRRAWAAFEAWCAAAGRQALPAAPATVAAYLLEAQGRLSLAAIEQHVAAVAWMHRGRGFDPPPTAADAVKMVMRGLRRQKGRRPKNAKRPIALPDLRAMLARVDRKTLAGKRDAAVLLVGWHAALRRSELVGIHREHLSDAEGGGAILIPKSKTDQEGEGHVVGIARVEGDPAVCPVVALWEWMQAAGIRTGPVFRGVSKYLTLRETALTGQAIADIVKRYAGAAGLPPEPFAGHSLRAGHVTEAYRQGVPEAQIMETTRHKSATMLARYRREANPVKRGSAGALDFTKGKK